MKKQYNVIIFVAAILGFGGFSVIALGGAAWYYFKYSKGGGESAITNLITADSITVDEAIPEQEMICDYEDIVEFQNLMQGCSGLTSQAKSNYQKARPSIEAIAKKNGFIMYEYHYVNGDLGQGEMSSYCCYLYKNCTIRKSDGYPTFTPTNKGIGCVLSDGEITVYDKDSYDKLVKQIREKCGNQLYSETEGVEEEEHYYSDGKYCYYMDCIGSGEYRIPIRKKVDEDYVVSENNDLDWLQGHWVYEQGNYKGHFIIQGDKITQYSSMNPERETSTFRIEGDEILSRIANGVNLTVKIDFANHTIDYGDGCWMHKVE